jgi:hypothetical protein
MGARRGPLLWRLSLRKPCAGGWPESGFWRAARSSEKRGRWRAWCAASCRERERELDADGDAHADLLDQIQRRDGSPRAAPPGVRVYVLVAFFLPNNVVIARSSVFVRPFLRVIIMSGENIEYCMCVIYLDI